MTRLRPSLKNSARAGLRLLAIILLLYGCSSSSLPKYHYKENIPEDITAICSSRYNIEVKAKLTGATLWIYIPLENIVTKADRPDKYVERFAIEKNDSQVKDAALKVDYLIKAVPEQIKSQEVKFEEKAMKKVNDVGRALRQVLLHMKHADKDKIKFICMVVADIQNGFMLKQEFYYEDMKKAFYGILPSYEFSYRRIDDLQIAPEILGDKEGKSLNYHDITFAEFITDQIKHRVRMTFPKAKFKTQEQLDKEILKIVRSTLKIYNFGDFEVAEFYNSLTQSGVIISKTALLKKTTDEKP